MRPCELNIFLEFISVQVKILKSKVSVITDWSRCVHSICLSAGSQTKSNCPCHEMFSCSKISQVTGKTLRLCNSTSS